MMRLEEALELREGTTLEATASWGGPEKVTKGRIYVMQADAISVRARVYVDPSYSKLEHSDQIVNAKLPIIDDRGKLMYPTYHHFKVVQ